MRVLLLAALLVQLMATSGPAQTYSPAPPLPRTTSVPELRAFATQREIEERFKIGLDAESRGDWKGAVAEFDRIVVLNPPEPKGSTARYDLAIAYANLQRNDEAARALRAAIALDPDFLAAMANLIAVDLARGDLREARSIADRYVALDPDSARALYSRGIVALQAGDATTAREDFGKLLHGNPSYAVAHYDLALAEERLGRYDAAERELEQRARARAGVRARAFRARSRAAAPRRTRGGAQRVRSRDGRRVRRSRPAKHRCRRCATRSRAPKSSGFGCVFRLSSSAARSIASINHSLGGSIMSGKLAALSVALAAAALAACGGHYGSSVASNDSTFALPGMPDLRMTATNPDGSNALVSRDTTGTISEELPSEGLGTIKDPHWQATLGGFTQQTYSQALGFRARHEAHDQEHLPDHDHTLNVVKKIAGPPAVFPSNPTLPTESVGRQASKRLPQRDHPVANRSP